MTAFFLLRNRSPIASGDGGFFRSSYDPGERCSLVVQHQEVEGLTFLSFSKRLNKWTNGFRKQIIYMIDFIDIITILNIIVAICISKTYENIYIEPHSIYILCFICLINYRFFQIIFFSSVVCV